MIPRIAVLLSNDSSFNSVMNIILLLSVIVPWNVL